MITRNMEDIANLAMYSGPQLNELIKEAQRSENEFKLEHICNGGLKLSVKSQEAYNVKIIDCYIYDSEEKLIKHSIDINGKNKVIFDKYNELRKIIIKNKGIA